MNYKPTYHEIDDENLPQTTQIFDAPEFEFNKHHWVQQGYELIDMCPNCPRQGVPIPFGKMLVKEKGVYKLVDEVTRK